MNIKKKIKDIIFRDDLYPRFEPNQGLIKKYSESLEYLPPIKIDQHNILIDGFHRLKAHELAELTDIECEVIEVKSEKELKMLAYKWNSNHGLQLSGKEKKDYAIEMFYETTKEELSNILSVSERTIDRWTESLQKEKKKKEKKTILEEYLRAWNSQNDVAEIVGISQDTISKTIKNFKENGHLSKIFKDFESKEAYKKLYNMWNVAKDSDIGHFGHFPKIFMDNLLYYHTEPFDIIYDPFSGDGTTIDSCKEFYRRYYCADRQMKPGREKDMKEQSIQDGYPEDLQKPDLVFLDPPYWKQAKGKYSDSKEDLANMELEDFYEIFGTFLNELIKRKIERIAIVISPTQYPNNLIFEDHIFKFYDILRDKYFIEMRYILPYSTQQYNGTQVLKAKEERKCLTLNRDLVIWKLRGNN